MKRTASYLPGFVLALTIAAISKFLEGLLPIHLIGASVIALFLGMAVNHFHKPGKTLKPGLAFTSKKVLKFAIVLLGASLSIGTILHIGRLSLTVMVFTLLTCFGGGYFVGRALKLNWKLSNLISAGTGICGGSAIAAIAADYPGVKAVPANGEEEGAVWKIDVPKKYDIGHEAHFSQVMQQFLTWVKVGKMPEMERRNLLVKYYTLTEAWKMSR